MSAKLAIWQDITELTSRLERLASQDSIPSVALAIESSIEPALPTYEDIRNRIQSRADVNADLLETIIQSCIQVKSLAIQHYRKILTQLLSLETTLGRSDQEVQRNISDAITRWYCNIEREIIDQCIERHGRTQAAVVNPVCLLLSLVPSL